MNTEQNKINKTSTTKQQLPKLKADVTIHERNVRRVLEYRWSKMAAVRTISRPWPHTCSPGSEAPYHSNPSGSHSGCS